MISDREFVAHVLLNVHIGFAAWSMTAGILSLATKKGSRLHSIAGKCFYWGFLGVLSLAVVLTILHPYPFGTLLALGAFYMTLSGRRALLVDLNAPTAYDWGLAIFGIVLGLLLLAWAGVHIARHRYDFMPVMLALGSAQLLCRINDVRALRIGRRAISSRVGRHLARMLGAFTAAVLGFLVTAPWLKAPELIVWLVPPAIALCAMFWWRRRWVRPSAVPGILPKLFGERAPTATIQEAESRT